MLRSIYALWGRMAYVTLLPCIRLALGRSKRAYVILYAGGEILLVKNWLSRQTWRLPGGGIEWGESLRDGAAREVREELGIHLVASDLQDVYSDIWLPDNLGFSFHILVAQLPQKPNLHPDRLELVGWRWFKPTEVNPDTQAEVHRGLRLAGLID